MPGAREMSLPCGRDAWAGGFCELAIQLGPLNDAHLQQGLRARAAREGERFTAAAGGRIGVLAVG